MSEYPQRKPIEINVLSQEELKKIMKGLENGTLCDESEFLNDDDTDIQTNHFNQATYSKKYNIIPSIAKGILKVFLYLLIALLSALQLILSFINVIITHIVGVVCGLGLSVITFCFLGDLLFHMSENPFYQWLPFYGFFFILFLIPVLANFLPTLIENIKEFIEVNLLT